MQSTKALVYSTIIVWIALLVAGYVWTVDYGFTTYETPNNFRQSHWPQDSRIALAADRPTLLLFFHPRCPCTRASIRELEKLLTGHGLTSKQCPKIVAVATIPCNAPDEWRHTDTITSALQLPNASIAWDVDGMESRRFGAVTSGTVMLYFPSGSRVFAGGVTVSRGHEGDNIGSEKVLGLLTQHDQTPMASRPVFGCRLCIADSDHDFRPGSDRRTGGTSGGRRGEQQ